MNCPRCDSELEVTSTKTDSDDFGGYIDVSLQCTSETEPHHYFARVRQADLLEDD